MFNGTYIKYLIIKKRIIRVFFYGFPFNNSDIMVSSQSSSLTPSSKYEIHGKYLGSQKDFIML